VSQFIAETCDKTGSNAVKSDLPGTNTRDGGGKSLAALSIIDYLVHVFGLVRIDEGDEAVKFFATWKARIEGVENQKYVLVIFYPVQTVGDFF